MKKVFVVAAAGLAGVAAQAQVQAPETGRVLASVPVVQQVAVPHQVCSQQPMVVQQQPSGAGAVMGGIAGGALGNMIGQGSGNAAATAIGLIGGAMLGNRVEGGGNYVQNVQQCSTQTTYENRTVAYNVTYEYGGRNYTVQMPYDPGPSIPVQVSPVGAAPAQAPLATAPQPVYGAPAVVESTTVVVPGTVVYPATYYRPYYPPVGISLGYTWGGPRYRHWR